MLHRFLTGSVAFLGVVLFWGSTAQARLVEGSLWESKQLPETVLSVQAGDIDRDGQMEIITVSTKRLSIHKGMPWSDLTQVTSMTAKPHHSFHRIWLGDYNSDGQWDLLLNYHDSGRLRTLFFNIVNGKLQKLQNSDELVVPLYLDGQWRLFAQTLYQGSDFSKNLYEMTWSGKKYTRGKLWKLKSGTGQKGQSLLAMTGMGPSFVEYDGSNRLRVTDLEGKHVFRTGLRFGGAYDYIEMTGSDALGLKNQQRIFLPPRNLFTPLENKLLVIRNEGYLKSVIGAIPSMKAATLTLLDWDGARLKETASMPRHDGAITDMALIDVDGDGRFEILASYLVRKLGYLDSIRGQESIIVLLPWDKFK